MTYGARTHRSGSIAQWMGGALVESHWERCAGIVFTGKLHKYTYRDRSKVLAVQTRKLLKYSHWAGLSRLPDLPSKPHLHHAQS
jgi:hypothetical protein